MYTRKTRCPQPVIDTAANNSKTTLQLKNSRPETERSIGLQQLADNSPQIRETMQLQTSADQYTAQLKVPGKENQTGLPDNLKSGIENLSGYSMDDVKVHYNSAKPAGLQAHAYAQGSDIHVAPGQEKHLAHEAWHVVQQKQGRVKPTTRLKKGVAVNDDDGLEKEADEMGTKALASGGKTTAQRKSAATGPGIVQRVGIVRFANVDRTVVKYSQKADDIVDTLQNTPVVTQFLGNKNLLITLESSTTSMTPAAVSTHGEQVRIQLSPWFFEQESRGRIIGMLAHELGVHPMARAALTGPEQLFEQNAIQNQTPLQTGLNNETVHVDGINQTDHIFASLQGRERFNMYQQTVYEMGTQMDANQGQTQIRDQHITDLILTYLADMAMILATNDHREKTILKLERTADYFNMLRGNWLAFLNAQPNNGGRLPALTPPVQTNGDVFKQVGGVLGSFVLSIFTDSTSKVKEKQTRVNGVYPALTTNQTEILGDYNLNLQPKAFNQNLPTFMNTLDAAGGVARNNLDGVAIQRLNQIIINLAPNAPNLAALTRIRDGIQNGVDTDKVNDEFIRVMAQILQLTIRVIRSNGKMDTFDFQHGNMRTLLEVDKPGPHYRYAT